MVKIERIRELEQDNKHQSISAVNHLLESLKLFKISEASLIYMFIINFLVSIQYYVLITLIPLYFSTEHGFSNFESGLVFGAFGIIIGICSLYFSCIIQKIQFKRGLYLSILFGVLGFSLMMTNNIYMNLFSIIFLQAISCSLAWPFIEYGIKEFSTSDSRNLCSSLFFISNYLAGILSGFAIDILWKSIEIKYSIYMIGYSISILALCTATIFIILTREIEIQIEANLESHEHWDNKKFTKFSFFILLLTLLRSAVFGHLDATLPKYIIKIQSNNAHFGLMLIVHSLVMIFGLFTLTTLTYSYSSYWLIAIGGLIGSFGSIFLIFFKSTFALILFVAFVSIGESIWVPRLLDYTFSIAPKTHEGIYLAMSNCPFYFGMILTGGSSGLMLDNLCSEDIVGECRNIWVLIFFSSFTIVGLLIILKPVLNQDVSSDAYINTIE